MKRYKSNRIPKRIIGCGNLRCETCKHMFGTKACEAEEGLIIEEISNFMIIKNLIKPSIQTTLKSYS